MQQEDLKKDLKEWYSLFPTSFLEDSMVVRDEDEPSLNKGENI